MSELNHEFENDWLGSRQKRAMDIAGSVALAPMLGAAGLVCAGAIVTADHANPLYTGARYGDPDTPFRFYKFRTMPVDTPETPSLGSSADPRATKLGQTLREKHFDEIPQLYSIFRGDMALVGPRALIREDISNTLDILSHDEQQQWRRARKLAKPGVTGPLQIAQHNSDYTLEGLLYQRALIDIEYAQTATLSTDIDYLLQSAKISSISTRSLLRKDTETGHDATTMLSEVAAGYGAEVGGERLSWWRAAFAASRVIDDLVDKQHVTDTGDAVQALLDGSPVEGLSPSESEIIKDAFSEAPEAERAAALTAFAMLPVLADKRQHATSANELSWLCDQESRLFSRMFYLPGDNQSAERFNRWVDSFARFGYYVDAIVDLKDDYEQGICNVVPTAANKARLLKDMPTHDSLRAARLPLKIYPRVARQALRTLVYK